MRETDLEFVGFHQICQNGRFKGKKGEFFGFSTAQIVDLSRFLA